MKIEEGDDEAFKGSYRRLIEKSFRDFSEKKIKQEFSWDQDNNVNNSVLEENSEEISVEEICTVVLEVDVKKEFLESDGSSSDAIQRGDFKGNEDEKLLASPSPPGSFDSLSPRLQIDLGEELDEQNSAQTALLTDITNRVSFGEKSEEAFKDIKGKGGLGLFGKMANDGGLKGCAGSDVENESNACAGENRCRNTATNKQEISNRGKGGPLEQGKVLAAEKHFEGEEEEKCPECGYSFATKTKLVMHR